MRLTSLEIKGFKSFADKTVINFNDSITGIVGPNGCGKSNIVDAVRWVLGEQKTSMLRSEKMENIIFNGSKQRKPSNLSEVSLTFENTKNLLPTEYNTVTISRVLSRDGESEYRLNNVPCRLKDITSLFLDTGISSDSYAIIELGMVNEILNDVDNSRRRLFEQAAGISKYKARKKETLNKLALTETDLNRVNDLLFEIENNLKILEQQAKKTQKFYQLREEYKTLSVELAIFTLSSYKHSFDQMNQQQQEEHDKKIALETEITRLESGLEQEKANEIARQQLLASIQKELNNHLNNIRQQENDRQIANEKLKFLDERKVSLQTQINAANNNLAVIHKDIEQLGAEKTREDELLKEAEAQLAELKNRLDAIRLDHAAQKENLDTRQGDFQKLEKNIFELEKKSAVNSTQKDNWLREIQSIEQDNSGKSTELNQLTQSFSELENLKGEKERMLAELSQHEEEIVSRATETENEIEKVKQELASENRKLDAKKNEYNLTKSLVDNMEGFPESIKFLKKNAFWGKNAPLLSDIISCKEDYRVAVENLLEPYLNYYVVENLEEAISAVNLLNEAAKGKANFFILDELPETTGNGQHAALNNAVPALSVLDINDRYQRLTSYLLGNVYVLDDTQGFQADSLKNGEGKVLITKSGKFVRSKYALSGGSVGLFEGKKIGRAKNLEVLQSEIAEIEKHTASLSSQLADLQSGLQQLKNSSRKNTIEEERNNLNRLNNEYFSLKTKTESIQSLLASNHQKKNTAEENIRKAEAENESLNSQLNEWKQAYTALADEIKTVEQNFSEISGELNSCNENFSNKNIQFIQQQNKVSSIQQNLIYKQQQLNDYHAQILQNTATLESSEMEVIEIHEKLKALEESLISLYETKNGMEQSVSKAEKDYYDTKGAINELDTKIRSTGKSKEQADMLLHEIRDKINNLKLELASLKERLAIEFKVDIDSIIDKEKSGEYNREELEQKVERLKNRLDNYGEINPMAVEAFNEMKQRYDFITNQKNDLTSAKDSLMQTISEIEATATDQFLQAFNKVRAHFAHLFRNLFEEQDECDLVLLDPSAPLESKLEIIAKPKGKKPLTINQLSGGEQTLTAIALLFSLYLLKPAPFCIFDEVDAPLDDINIDKFNKIIKRFAADSQFVIVTHNKQTMSAVDIIYGVTMAEEGVSRVVPVDFRSLN